MNRYIKPVPSFTYKPRLVKNVTDEAWEEAKIIRDKSKVDYGAVITHLLLEAKKKRLKHEAN